MPITSAKTPWQLWDGRLRFYFRFWIFWKSAQGENNFENEKGGPEARFFCSDKEVHVTDAIQQKNLIMDV